jgi:hypothetical protein
MRDDQVEDIGHSDLVLVGPAEEVEHLEEGHNELIVLPGILVELLQRGDPLLEVSENAVVEVKARIDVRVQREAELSEESFALGGSLLRALEVRSEGLEIEQNELQPTQVRDCCLEHVVVDVNCVALSEVQHVQDILEDYDLSSFELDLREAVGNTNFILRLRIASYHDGGGLLIRPLRIVLLVQVDELAQSHPSWREPSQNALFLAWLQL